MHYANARPDSNPPKLFNCRSKIDASRQMFYGISLAAGGGFAGNLVLDLKPILIYAMASFDKDSE